MINSSKLLLENIRERTDKIIVGVSGGKDSLVVADLCNKYFKGEIHFFFLYFILGLECEEKYVRFIEKKYRKTVHRLLHPSISDYLRGSYMRNRTVATDSMPRLRWNDVEAVIRSRTGADWLAYGHRISDSLHRRGMIMSDKGILEKPRRSYPIWDWSPREVFGYLRSNRIPIPGMFGAGVQNTSGISPSSPECILYLKEHYPADYDKMISVFPRMETIIDREEQRAVLGINAENRHGQKENETSVE